MKRIALFLLLSLAALDVRAQTFLVGDNTQVAVASAVGGNTGGSAVCSLKSATATGTVSVGWFYTTSTGDVFIMFVTNASGTLLGTSSASASTTSGWNQVSFSSGPSLTSSTTYGVCILDQSSVYYNQGTGGSGSWTYQNTGITYPTPPNPYTLSGTGSSSVDLSAYFTTSAGSCTHNFWSSTGAFSQPNGTTGSYWSISGAWATPNCTSGSYWRSDGTWNSN